MANKITEKALVTQVTEETSLLITQAEAVGGVPVESLRRVKLSTVARNILSEAASPIVRAAENEMVQINDGAERPLLNLSSTIRVKTDGSGWDSIKLIRCGRNLYSGGTRTFEKNIRVDFPVPLPPGTYTIGALVESSDTDLDISSCVLLDEGRSSIVYANLQRGVYNTQTVTIAKECHAIRFYASNNDARSEGDTATWDNIMIHAGSESIPFEPYAGQAVTVALPETVYGGMLDWLTGELIASHAADGSMLEESVTYQLTPVQMDALYGYNTIWSSCGQTYAAYIADTMLYINERIATAVAAMIGEGGA